MSSAASIAQFMALLSGGTNPALFRQGTGNGLNSNASQQKGSVDFQSLVNGGNGNERENITKTDLTEKIRGLLKAAGDALPQGTALSDLPESALASLKSKINSEIVAYKNANSAMDAQIAADFQLTDITDTELQSIISRIQGEDNNGVSSSAIWQFIRQQASVDGKNAIVLNLSEKGIPQDVIDDLQNLFGTNDLITILRDPKLNTQLDNALENVNTETIETPQLASVVTAILQQNRGDISNTITFSVNKDAPIDQIIEDLVKDGYIENPGSVAFMPANQPEQKQPVNLTFVQQKLASSPAGQQAQSMAPAINGGNPFALQGRLQQQANTDGDMQPLPLNAGLEKAAEALANNPSNAAESIADRLANVIQNNNGQNANSQASSFANLMISADGESLMNADGDYVMPFEAGFKTASQAANPITAQQAASQSHPTSQMVAMSLQKMAGKAAGGEDSQSYRLKLDPPEMGRIDIEMDVIEKTGQLKAVISAEKPESLGLLQRDMHVLLKAMQDAGFEGMTEQDLTFNLSQGNDTMADNNSSGNNGFGGSSDGQADGQADNDMIAIEGEMTLIIDPVTGQKHVNMLV